MSSAESNPVDEHAAVQYLLGAAPEEQTELFDRLSVSDDEFVSRLSALENDLVDAYVRGELTGDTLERFRTFYLASPLRREKVRLAEALLPLADERALFPVVPIRRVAPSFPRLPLAAAACLVLAACAYWMLENSRPTQPAQPNLAIAPQPPVSSPPAPLANILFVLPPPTRGSAALPVLGLPSNAVAVTFRLQLEVNESPSYRVALKDLASNRIVWRSDLRPAVVEQASPSVVIDIPATLLQYRSYSLDLAGIAASGAAETIGAYAFQVTPK